MTDIFRAERAAVVYNQSRKSIEAVKAEIGCSHIINAGFCNMSTFAPLMWLVLDGKIISRDQYTDYGFAVENGKPVMSTDRGGDFVSLIPLLKGGKKLERSLTPDVARKAERSAVGWTASGEIVLAVTTAMTREELQAKMLSYGAIDALMCDGGGSAQGIFPVGKVLTGRKVPTFIAFWTKEEELPVGVKTYSKKTQGSLKLTPNFKVSEFACKDGTDKVLIDEDLPVLLQKIRDHYGAAITINSGYRTETYNAKVGGVTNSQHKLGKAADIVVKGHTPLEVAQYAEYLMPNSGGIGCYATFTHVDVRTGRSRWDQRSGTQKSVSGWPGYVPPEEELAVAWAKTKGLDTANLDKTITLKQMILALYRLLR